MLGIKQEALSFELGEGWSQQRISRIEAKEKINAELLEELGNALKVAPEIIKDFNVQDLLSCFNTIRTNASEGFPGNKLSTNSLDKIVEFYEEKIRLLERLLESEREKVEILKGK